MPGRLLPLFPLQAVVFPRTGFPLHIFEERYKEMVGVAIREPSEFGIVLAKDQGIVNAGCTVAVDQVLHQYPDGRMDIKTRGQRRFEIASVDEELDYLRGEVQYFDDDDLSPVPSDLRTQALALFDALRTLASSSARRNEPDLEDPQLSFQLAQGLPDLDFLSELLRQRSEAARLKELIRYLTEYIPRQRAIERARTLAPTNGLAGKHLGT